MEDVMTSGQAYTYTLLELWKEIIELGTRFRASYMNGYPDRELLYNYVASLTRLWGELSPKLKNRSEFGELKEEFDKFAHYYFDPKKLVDGDIEDVFKLELTLRQALERLKVFDFEGGS